MRRVLSLYETSADQSSLETRHVSIADDDSRSWPSTFTDDSKSAATDGFPDDSLSSLSSSSSAHSHQSTPGDGGELRLPPLPSLSCLAAAQIPPVADWQGEWSVTVGSQDGLPPFPVDDAPPPGREFTSPVCRDPRAVVAATAIKNFLKDVWGRHLLTGRVVRRNGTDVAELVGRHDPEDAEAATVAFSVYRSSRCGKTSPTRRTATRRTRRELTHAWLARFGENENMLPTERELQDVRRRRLGTDDDDRRSTSSEERTFASRRTPPPPPDGSFDAPPTLCVSPRVPLFSSLPLLLPPPTGGTVWSRIAALTKSFSGADNGVVRSRRKRRRGCSATNRTDTVLENLQRLAQLAPARHSAAASSFGASVPTSFANAPSAGGREPRSPVPTDSGRFAFAFSRERTGNVAVAELLARLDLDPKWASRFLEHEILSVRYLLALSARDLQTIVPPIGPRRVLEKYLRAAHPDRHSLDRVP